MLSRRRERTPPPGRATRRQAPGPSCRYVTYHLSLLLAAAARMICDADHLRGSSGMGAGRPGVNGSGRRLGHTRYRAAVPLIFYPGRFGNAALTRLQTIDSAGTAHRGGERLGHSVIRAEPHNLRTLTAEAESPAQRAESAIRTSTGNAHMIIGASSLLGHAHGGDRSRLAVRGSSARGQTTAPCRCARGPMRRTPDCGTFFP